MPATKTTEYTVSRETADVWNVTQCRAFVRYAHPEHYWVLKGLKANALREGTRMILDHELTANPERDVDIARARAQAALDEIHVRHWANDPNHSCERCEAYLAQQAAA